MNNNPQSPSPPLHTNAAIAGVPTRRRPSGSPLRGPTLTPALAFEYEMANGRSPNAGFMEEFLIISGLVAVQVIGAFYTVLLKPILSLGIKPLFLIIFGSLAMAFFIFPFAIALEKKKWPSRLSLTLVVQFILIALGGVTTFQALMFVGIKKTSPALASAMPNLAPGIIFIIAACLRIEKIDLKCNYTRTKIIGTLVCLAGAVALSFLQGPIEQADSQSSLVLPNPSPENLYRDWIIGCSCLLGAVLVLSCSTVLQAATMMEFPAPLSLCFVTSLGGSILTALVQFISDGKLDFGQPTISIQAIICFVFLGGMLVALCVAFQTWAVLRKGPVMVSMFSPIQTVCSAVLSAILLGQTMKFESLLGMLPMFIGLYMVLWAKNKEGFGLPTTVESNLSESSTDEEEGIERPLLT